MKLIPLTRNCDAIVDDEDYPTLAKHRWYCTSAGYAARDIRIDGKRKIVLMHREIMQPTDSEETDHRFGNRLDNRKSELRNCTHSQNMANSNIPKNKSGYRGVHPQGNKWVAFVTVNGNKIYLGIFNSAKEAANVRDKAAKKYFGDFSKPSL